MNTIRHKLIKDYANKPKRAEKRTRAKYFRNTFSEIVLLWRHGLSSRFFSLYICIGTILFFSITEWNNSDNFQAAVFGMNNKILLGEEFTTQREFLNSNCHIDQMQLALFGTTRTRLLYISYLFRPPERKQEKKKNIGKASEFNSNRIICIQTTVSFANVNDNPLCKGIDNFPQCFIP